MKLTAKEKSHQYYLKNKDKALERAKKWKEKNPEKARESSRKSIAKNRLETPIGILKGKELKHKYGLSWEEYLSLYEGQNGGCAICKTPLLLMREEYGYGSGNRTANVDHNHTTKKIRGLLCNRCNQGIGYLQDSPTLLRLAAEYLDASDG